MTCHAEGRSSIRRSGIQGTPEKGRGTGNDIMPFTIKKSKTFKGKFEVRSKTKRLFATALTNKEAIKVKNIANRFERCVKKVKKKPGMKKVNPFAVCRAAVVGKGNKIKKLSRRKKRR